MTYYTDQETTIERNGRDYTVKLEIDTNMDTSHLGEYKRTGETWCIWRLDGTLRGGYNTDPEPIEPEQGDYPSTSKGDADWNAAYDVYDAAYDAWNANDPTILSSEQHTAGRNELEYFIPYASGIDPEQNPTEWAKRAIQDYDRMEDLNRGGWCYVGVVVTINAPPCATCKHTEPLYASLWGIESDSGDAYFDTIVSDLIAELEPQLV